MNKKIKIFVIISIILIVCSFLSYFIWQTPQQDKTFNYLPKSEEYLDYGDFQIKYDTIHKQPSWVAFEFNSAETIANVERGSRNFKRDPLFSNTPTKSVYAKSEHDLGHMIPARAMQYDEDALKKTFYMTNVSPQKPSFNRGVWKKLETRVRKWAEYDEQIYVVSGAILTDTLPKLKGVISIPDYYYKVILDLEPEKKVIAFLLENKKSKKDLKSFVISVDSLEKLTKIDYFYSLNDKLEHTIESRIILDNWNFD